MTQKLWITLGSKTD